MPLQIITLLKATTFRNTMSHRSPKLFSIILYQMKTICYLLIESILKSITPVHESKRNYRANSNH